jgi:hypothetical protein
MLTTACALRDLSPRRDILRTCLDKENTVFYYLSKNTDVYSSNVYLYNVLYID